MDACRTKWGLRFLLHTTWEFIAWSIGFQSERDILKWRPRVHSKVGVDPGFSEMPMKCLSGILCILRLAWGAQKVWTVDQTESTPLAVSWSNWSSRFLPGVTFYSKHKTVFGDGVRNHRWLFCYLQVHSCYGCELVNPMVKLKSIFMDDSLQTCHNSSPQERNRPPPPPPKNTNFPNNI
jgi:hypothetical protein